MVDSQRTNLKTQFSSFSQFNQSYIIDQQIIDQLIAFGEKEGVPYSSDDFKQSQLLITTQIKALIARDLWSSSEYYQVINPIVDTYKEAIRILETKNSYNNLLK